MARQDLLLALVKAGVAGDRAGSRRVAEAMAADERAKQRPAFAERLETAMQTAPRTSQVAPADDLPGLQARIAYRALDSIILDENTRTELDDFIEEHERRDLLRSHGLEPRNKIALVGPPGTGKTSLAEALANALAVPFNVVRYDSLVGSYLGETSARLRRVFEYARSNPCVLFFDEFDAIGKERGDASDVGELKRVVASLLTQIDEMPSTTIIICATNHPELLDRAAWRRFDLRLTLPMPDQDDLDRYFSALAASVDEPLGLEPSRIAQQLIGASYADAEALWLDARRKVVLSLGARALADVFARLLSTRIKQARDAAPGDRKLTGEMPTAAKRKRRVAQSSLAESLKLAPQDKPSSSAARTGPPKKPSRRKNAKPPSHSTAARRRRD